MEVLVGKKYRHYKGKEYLVLALATHSETLEKYVVYQALYGEKEVWIRPYEMFCETVLIHGNPTPRFAYIETSNEKEAE